MRYRQAIIIGRFLPLHNGHRYIIDYAHKQAQSVVVVLCSLPNEAIAGTTRLQWINALYPRCKIVHITTPNPAAERDRPQAVNIWAQTIKQHISVRQDSVVVGSEHYVAQLAQLLGCAADCVDIERSNYQISGRQIMQRPLVYLDMVPKVVRSYFILTVVIHAESLTHGTALSSWLDTTFNRSVASSDTSYPLHIFLLRHDSYTAPHTNRFFKPLHIYDGIYGVAHRGDPYHTQQPSLYLPPLFQRLYLRYQLKQHYGL